MFTSSSFHVYKECGNLIEASGLSFQGPSSVLKTETKVKKRGYRIDQVFKNSRKIFEHQNLKKIIEKFLRLKKF